MKMVRLGFGTVSRKVSWKLGH